MTDDLNRLQSLRDLVNGASLKPITLCVSPGRCGTVFLKAIFSRAYPDQGVFLHERLSAHAAQPALHFRCFDLEQQELMLAQDAIYAEIREILNTAKQRPVAEFGHYLISCVPVLHAVAPDALRVLVVHRHPVQSAGSHAIKGHYVVNKSPTWALTPNHRNVCFPGFASRWNEMTAFEKELFRWLEITSYGLELPDRLPNLQWKCVRSDDMFRNIDVRREIAEFCGFHSDANLLAEKENATTDFNREMLPVGDEWRKTSSYQEVVRLAEFLGYDMTTEVLEKLVAPYQFPGGILPLLRKHTGFWSVVRLLAKIRGRF